MSQNSERKNQTPQGFHRAVPVILVALSIFITLCFFTQNTGTVGRLIASLLTGLFARGAYLIPILLLIHAIFYISDIEERRLLSRAIFSFVALLSLSAFLYTVGAFGKDLPFTPGDYYKNGIQGIGGGFFGSILAFAIMKIFGGVGLILIALLVFALYITFFFSKERNVFVTLGIRLLYAFLETASFIERKIKSAIRAVKGRRHRRQSELDAERCRELYADDFFAVDTGLSHLQIKSLGILEGREIGAVEENLTLQEKVYLKAQSEKASEEGDEVTFTERKRTVSFEAQDDLLVSTEGSDKEPIVYDDPRSASLGRSAALTRADQDADAVFTKEFDPFDIAVNEALSSKNSSKTKPMIPVATEELSPLSEEEAKERARKEEFERRRAMLIANAQKEQAKASAPTPATATSSQAFGFGTESVREVMGQNKKDTENTGTFVPEKSVAFSRQETEVVHTEKTAPLFTATIEKPETKTTATTFTFGTPIEDTPPVVSSVSEPTVFTFGEEKSEDTATSPEYRTIGKEEEPTVFTFGEKTAEDTATSHEEEPLTQKEEPTPTTFEFQTELAEAPYQAPVFRAYAPEDVLTVQAPEEPETTLTVERSMIGEAFASYQTAHREEEPAPSLSPAFEEDEEDIEEDELDDDLTENEDYSDGEEEAEDILSPIPEEEQNPEILAQRGMFSFLKEEDAAEVAETLEEDTPPFALDESEEEDEEDGTPDYEPRGTSSRFNDFMNSMRSQTKEKIREVEEEQEKQQKEAHEEPDYSDYKFPSLDMLVPGYEEVDLNLNAEIQENAEKLIETLSSFRVSASIKGVDSGPRITRYEVVPARGVRVSSVTGLFDDISLALAAPGIRMEAPIPGKSAIGFEIPNQKPKTVRLRDLIEADEFQSARSKTFVCIGKDVTGNPVFGDIAKMPHVLVAGATGMGKSVCINAIMISMLFRSRPDEVKFIMIDPKKVEFNGYNGIPHLLVPVVTDPKQAAGALMWACEEMDKRFDDIERLRVKKIDDYNAKVAQDPTLGKPMPKIVIVIDELNDLMIQVRDPVENLIMRIAQKARAAGIHLIIGTQRPSVNVITGVIKANIPSRISCKVSSSTDSRTILEQTGAEKLLNNGDMLFWPVGKPKPLRVQGAFVSDDEVENIMEFLRAQAKGDTYNSEVMDQINRAAQKCSKHGADDDEDEDGDDSDLGEGFLNDQKFLDAVNLTLNAGKVATSFLQRKLEIGYGRAAKYIDIMEDLGIIGEKNGQKPRDVLITKQDWNEMLARRSLD